MVNEEILREFDPLSGRNTATTSTKPSPEQTSEQQSDNSTHISGQDLRDESHGRVESEREDPPLGFQLFIQQLKTPEAEPIVKYLKSFLHNFCTRRVLWSASEQQKLISDFKTFIYDKLLVFEPFKSLTESQLTNAQEGLEKLIMGKLYSRCFSPSLKDSLNVKLDDEHEGDLLGDIKLRAKTEEYQFIELENLDISTEISTKLNKFMKLAINELSKINKFKAPRDKVVCILNCCKVIFGLLRHNNLDKEGADSFIPLLITVVLKGNVGNLYSNVKYIERFRDNKFMKSEETYYLSSVLGAINFIQEMDESTLTIADRDTFRKKYLSNQDTLEEQRRKETDETVNNNNDTLLPTTLDDVTNSMATMVNDFLLSYGGKNATGVTPTQPTVANDQNATQEIAEQENDAHINRLILQLEERDNEEALDTLQSMFPDIDKDIIHDIGEAKRYRIGECVDALLQIFN
ncbi:guanine nucleotide exchange factor VPS9 KNAG_0G03620 [Huiozyma naganishii CBS 8797]|uniref:VPS9 domain-containing protein n=1 Tax=Huiozyma naganishii (strain ATCC MYA-139 / BCRC 22969 / CBS 8797 / KCTC 17520 / NBRC 10181 / NCYC 3082 / Yp74L-3) TaxID=1071383 RepID=J7S889_HUIN7|nr:hypothetical protein KNAG_0G03620 [Kazachstania naganishii CBS 8797]CCK71419.1 hypothetical protein KNAG_0G03620 [Kazachstania naganishii CBS 8797]